MQILTASYILFVLGGNLIIFIKLVSASSITPVLVSPTSLNAPSCRACRERGITVAPHSFRLQWGGVTVNTLRYSYFTVERGIFSPGTHLSATYLQRRAFLNPHCSYHLYPAEADVKHSGHNRGWHSRNSELEIK